MDDQIREYWEQAHRSRDLAVLTGTNLAGHLEFLRAELPASGRTLCIGVGDGKWVRDVTRQSSAITWALDVVRCDIRRVVLIVDPASLPSDFFDLALSLWVAPHMDDDELADQLKNVVRSLTLNGVLALHYNEPLDPEQVPIPACVGRMKAGTVLRTREGFGRLVRNAGGVFEIVNSLDRSQYEMRMVVAHVRRTA